MGNSGEFQTTKIDYDVSETKFDYNFKTRKAESSYDFGHETSYFEADDLTNTAWLNDDECQILKQSIGNEYKKHLNSARSTLEESSQRYQDLKKILEEHGYHESMLFDEDTSEIKETVDIDALKQGDISLDSIVKSFGFENLESYLSQYQSAFQKYQKDLFCVQQWEFLLANLDYELDIKSESYFHYANLVNVAEEDILPFIYGTYIDKGTKNINVGFDYTKFQSDHPAIDPVSAIAKVQEMFGEDIEIKGVENAELVQELAKIQSEPCCSSIAQYYRFCWGEKSPSEASQYIQNMENAIHNYCGQVKAKEFLNKLGTDNNAIETILNHLKIASHGIGRGYEDVFKNIDYVLESFIKDNRTISADEYEQMYLIQALSSKQDKIDNGLVLQNLNGDIYSAQKNSIIDYTKNYGIFSDDVAQMSTSVGNMIPSMLLSMMNKKMGLVTMAISSAGGAYHNSMVQGHGKIASAVYGTTSGLIETLLEKKLGGMPFLGDVQVTNLSSLFQASGKEFGEEFLETYVDNIAQSIILNEEFDGKEVAKEALQSGVYGMINSGFANATQLAIHNSLSSLSPKNAPIETFTDVDTEEISKIFENTKEDFQTNLVDEIDASHGLYQPDSLNERLNNLFTKVKEAENIEHLSIEDGVLTVTMDENFKNWQRENKIDSVDDVMMVHCTNFLPKNGVILSSAEGGKIITANITGYDGKKTKETPALLHRNTVHFVLNSAVLSNTGGDWTNTKFVILEPYKYHQDEFINAKLCEADGRKFMSGNSDAYTRQSVKLENPILLVEDSEYDKIKNNPDIANQFSIVKFKGIYSECAKVLLDKLGYPVFNMDPNSGEHFRSNEKFAEKILTDRDRSYNYVCNDEYDGTSNKIVDLNTLNKMYKTFSYNFGVTEQKISDQIAPKLDSKFVTFMTTIKPLDDNSYQFMDDNETLDMIYHQEKIDAESYEHVYELIKFQDSLESNPNASFQVTLSRYDDIDSIMAENPDFQILDRKEIKNQILYTIGLSNSNVNSVEAFQKVESIQDSLKNVKPKPQESYTVSDVFYDREKMRLLGDWVKHNVPENCKIGWVSEELCLSLPYNQKQENMLKLNGIKYEYDESNQKLVIKVSEKNDKIVQAVENIQNIVSKIE